MAEEKIKQLILEQLKLGACCRIHLHREVCLALGLSTIPQYNEKNIRTRICKDMSDNRFDSAHDELVKEKKIRIIQFKTLKINGEKITLENSKTMNKIGIHTFYELVRS